MRSDRKILRDFDDLVTVCDYNFSDCTNALQSILSLLSMSNIDNNY